MKNKIENIRIDKKDSETTPRQTTDAQNGTSHPSSDDEDMRQRVERIREDLKDIKAFWDIQISPQRSSRLKSYLEEQLADLQATKFKSYDQQAKIDYLLLKNYLQRDLRQLALDQKKDKDMQQLLPFASTVIQLCEDRQQTKPVDGQKAATDVVNVGKLIACVENEIRNEKIKIAKSSAYRAANTVDALRKHLAEWFRFFKGYDPLFTWWIAEPYAKVDEAMRDLAETIRELLVGIKPGVTDAIVGEPIGRDGLLADLEAEMIPYSPEEVIGIGEKEYVWCEAEMKKAAAELGYDDWKDALEYVKTLYVPPGEQPQLVRFLAEEAVDYVRKHDLVTVPRVAEESWRTLMMPAVDQKTNPFFLGGEDIIVSYPDDSMSHEAKLMSMRGNNIHFSRSTVFHELVPGHHLQFYSIARYKAYRQMFDTPFWMEGWALYWEMILWDKKFPKTPENKIGMLFWRMHRCARIIFSVKFHLGLLTPQECIDILVDMVGHERATAEGEVRRSFNGNYTPLYQAGYMLGALQLYSLRKELLNAGVGEKEYHDRVMKENEMPIEMLRALIKKQDVQEDFKTNWRFYSGH